MKILKIHLRSIPMVNVKGLAKKSILMAYSLKVIAAGRLLELMVVNSATLEILLLGKLAKSKVVELQ